jgi:putative nucleotidyltransferase with HDIG domain
MQRVEQIISQAKRLPPAPILLPRLLPHLRNLDSDLTEIVDLIQYDPSLTATVLRTCNSACFGFATPVDNLHAAISRLGYYEVYRIITVSSTANTLALAVGTFPAKELWEHSVAAAVAAEQIARCTGHEPEAAFTIGLLHDIGKLVLAQAFADRYMQLLQDVRRSDARLASERDLFGAHHGEVGGHLLARWKFPAHTIAAVWHHHQPTAAKPFEHLAACACLGNILAYTIGHGLGSSDQPADVQDEALRALAATPDALTGWKDQAVKQLAHVQTLFGLGGGS